MVLKTLIASSLNAQYMNIHDIFWRANCSWAGKKVVMMETFSFLFSLFWLRTTISRLVYAARERILAATFNYIRCSGRQLWFFRCRGSATTTFFVISEVIFMFDLQCWQYREIRHISAYTQQRDSSNWINQSWNLVRRDVIRRNKQTNIATLAKIRRGKQFYWTYLSPRTFNSQFFLKGISCITMK